MKLRIVIATSFGSQYNALNHFSLKLAEGLARFECEVIPFLEEKYHAENLKKFLTEVKPDFLITFFTHSDGKKNISEQVEYTTLYYTVDSLDYIIDSMISPYQITSVKDLFSYNFLREKVSQKVLFLPHAVEKELNEEPDSFRPFPVVFLGTCLDDSMGLKALEAYPEPFKDVIDRAVEHNFAHPELDYHISLLEGLKLTPGITPQLLNEYNLTRLSLILDTRLRVIDRIELLESIEDTEVHLFGNGLEKLNTWQNQFSHKSNFVFHDAVTFHDSIEIMKKAKIVLNSSPQVRTGSHERVLYSLACGAIPLTTYSPYFINEFGDNILTYSSNNWADVDQKIKEILNDEPLRIEKVKKGQDIIQKFHTWDIRAIELISQIQTFL